MEVAASSRPAWPSPSGTIITTPPSLASSRLWDYCYHMTPEQCRMARAALKWSIDDLREAAGVGRMTVVRFEGGQSVNSESVQAMRTTLEKRRVQFVDDGDLAGAVVRMKTG